jgi:hypothetical protein
MRLRLARAVAVLALLLGCDGEPETPFVPKLPDPCAGQCSEVELCARNEDGTHACAPICANQLHCWSGCCVPLEGTAYNICRPSNICYGN